MQMRILLVTPSYFPIVGGSEVLTHVLSTELNKLGVTADIMTFNMNTKWKPFWKEKKTKDGAATTFKEGAFNPFYGFPNPLVNLFRINLLPKLRFVSKFSDYDIIHFVGEADLSFPIFSYFVKKPKLLQCVGIFRKGGIYKYYNTDRPVMGKVFKSFFSRIADKFIISSSEEKELLIDLGVPENKIVLLPIGVDTEIFHPDLSKKNEVMLLFVGRIDRIKGLHTLLQALPFIKIPVKLTIVGPPWDKDYVKEIEKMSQEINSAGFHKVTMVGELGSKDLVPWYQKASLLVCPYIYETFSNVCREALACGTPVVSTGSHMVDNCSDGILLAKQDPRDLANIVNDILSKPEVCEKLGKDGRSIIEKYFSWDSVIKDLIKLYADTLKRYPE
jgi:glycosyltransferase involved in cell wall biosynthesis